MGGVAFIFSAISEPGVIAQTGGPCRILVGEMDCSRSDRVEELGAACRAAQIDAEATGDIRLALWDKLAFICAQAGMTAAVRLPMARSARCWRPWRSSGGSSRRFEPSPRPRESSWPKMRWTATKRSRAASSRDSSRPSTTTWCGGRRMELEALHGSVVRRAGVHGGPGPGERGRVRDPSTLGRPERAILGLSGTTDAPIVVGRLERRAVGRQTRSQFVDRLAGSSSPA
jgi:2-dehydropantoate 2-reductase